MSEKKDNIKSGLDISFDGGTVLNSISVAEKVEVKEDAKPEVNEPEIASDVKLDNNDVSVSEPTVSVETQIPNVPVFPEVPISMPEAIISPAPITPDLTNVASNPSFISDTVVNEKVVSTPIFTNNNFASTPLNDMNMPNAKEYNNSFNNTYGSILSFKTIADVEKYREDKHKAVDDECNAIIEVVKDFEKANDWIGNVRNMFAPPIYDNDNYKDGNNNFGGMNTPRF